MNRAVAALVLAALAAGCSPGIAGPRNIVAVRINHSRFAPERIEIARGATVRFVIQNDDPIDHEFIVGDASVQARHENGTEKHHGAIPGEVSVPAGTRRTTTVTFDEPGTLIFGCHLPGHYGYGMKGEIEIR